MEYRNKVYTMKRNKTKDSTATAILITHWTSRSKESPRSSCEKNVVGYYVIRCDDRRSMSLFSEGVRCDDEDCCVHLSLQDGCRLFISMNTCSYQVNGEVVNDDSGKTIIRTDASRDICLKCDSAPMGKRVQAARLASFKEFLAQKAGSL